MFVFISWYRFTSISFISNQSIFCVKKIKKEKEKKGSHFSFYNFYTIKDKMHWYPFALTTKKNLFPLSFSIRVDIYFRDTFSISSMQVKSNLFLGPIHVFYLILFSFVWPKLMHLRGIWGSVIWLVWVNFLRLFALV